MSRNHCCLDGSVACTITPYLLSGSAVAVGDLVGFEVDLGVGVLGVVGGDWTGSSVGVFVWVGEDVSV